MKAAFLTSLLLASTAAAQVLHPIDQRRPLEANGKTVETSTVNLDTLPRPTRTAPVSPLPGQNLPSGKVIDTSRVDTTTLQRASLPAKVLPQANFAAKRATVTGSLPAADTVKTSGADIEKLVIRPGTPAGAEELKQQLNHPR